MSVHRTAKAKRARRSTLQRESRRERQASRLADAAGLPRSGPCGLCGGTDARHRVVDAIRERHRAGDSFEDLARDYKLSADQIRTLCGEAAPA